MKKLEGKMFLFLVAAILVLCAGFFIVGCGVGPATKAVNTNTGNFALDFDDCPSGTCSVAFSTALNNFEGKPLTFEAWLKPTATSTSTILHRKGSSRGASLTYTGVSSTTVTPKFTIVRAITSISPTSTATYDVSAASNITINIWSHVTGILTDQDHSGVGGHPVCAGVGANGDATDDDTHLDIYIGDNDPDTPPVISACSYTWGGNTAMTIACDGAGVYTFSPAHELSVGDQVITSTSVAGCNITAGTSYEVCTVPSTTTATLDDTVGCGSPLGTALTAAVAMIDPTTAANAYAHEPLAHESGPGPFLGIIDEARIWNVARTVTQLATCDGDELSIGGNCDIGSDDLITYFRFNTGSGHFVYDASGNIGAGAKEYPEAVSGDCPPEGFCEWPDVGDVETGWSTDTPF